MSPARSKSAERPVKRQMSLTPDLVARCFRVEPNPGPNPDFTALSDAELTALADNLLVNAPPGPIWVFAYGSLIWSPGFAVAAAQRATALGWHRQFCLETTRWRSTPDKPGLMLALSAGGRCNGLILRLPEAEAAEIVHKLVRREIDVKEDVGMARWVSVVAENGARQGALTFWAGPKGRGIHIGLPLETVARRLAHACGHIGSSAEYLHNTVAHLEEHGIRDRNLWRLQELVAVEIQSWPQS